MKTNFKLLGLGLLLLLMPSLTHAQEILTGFNQGHHKPVAARQRTVRALPFYDDFSEVRIYPDSTKWIDNHVFVNSGFPKCPVTRQAATFDVLDASGCVYDYAISNPFVAECLTSTTIRLDSVFDPEPKALSPADSVYLSFFYQPQGNGNPPEAGDSLVLVFGIPNEFDTTWHHVWSVPGQTLSSFLQENDSNYFKQVMIPITDMQYFTSNFFFRFYNYASIASQTLPSSRGNEDNWSIDAVYLDWNRTATVTHYPKICFTGPVPTFLNRYQAMPYKHYRANPFPNTAEWIQLHLSNLDDTVHNIHYHYTIEQVNGNFAYTYTIPHDFDLEPRTYHEMEQFSGKMFPLDYDRDSASFLVTHYLSDTTCNPPLADTLVHHQGFYNYFAYDDGTPEMGYGVEPSSGAFAVQFKLSEVDTIRGVQILFNHTLNDANYQYFDIVIWKDNNGKPGDEVYRLSNRRPIWMDNIYQFAFYTFDEIVRLNGVFYIGIVQQSSGVINVGFDTSFDNSEFNFFNVTGRWQQSTMPGSIMIRPVTGRGYYIGTEEQQVADQVTVYPNPASSTLHIEGVEHGESITVYDMTGRSVMQARFSDELSVEQLRSGLYLLQITTAEGAIFHKKITIRQ